jgi:adenylate kinase
MRKIAVIIYGPPGSGKSTQADLVATAFGLIRFDTGRYIEGEIYSEEHKNNPYLQEQRKRYESGLLCDKDWVLKIVTKHLNATIGAGYGVVFSGSPRTMYEAFSEGDREGEYDLLVKGYGEKNVFVFSLTVPPEASLHRNQNRKVCEICERQYLFEPKTPFTRCPFCAAPLTTRTLDTPDVIKERLKEFERETMPVLEEMKRRNIPVHEIRGDVLPFEVFREISQWLS